MSSNLATGYFQICHIDCHLAENGCFGNQVSLYKNSHLMKL